MKISTVNSCLFYRTSEGKELLLVIYINNDTLARTDSRKKFQSGLLNVKHCE